VKIAAESAHLCSQLTIGSLSALPSERKWRIEGSRNISTVGSKREMEGKRKWKRGSGEWCSTYEMK
jgi:hypothetical protein